MLLFKVRYIKGPLKEFEGAEVHSKTRRVTEEHCCIPTCETYQSLFAVDSSNLLLVGHSLVLADLRTRF